MYWIPKQLQYRMYDLWLALLPPSPTFVVVSIDPWPDEDNFNPNALPSPPSSWRGDSGGQKMHPSVPLKRRMGPSEASSSAWTAPSFDWGPLSNFPSSPGMTKTTIAMAFVPLSTTIKTPLNKQKRRKSRCIELFCPVWVFDDFWNGDFYTLFQV